MKTALIIITALAVTATSFMGNVFAAEQNFSMPVESGLTALKLVEVTQGTSWEQKEGVLISQGEGESYLVTLADYGNFVLELDFKPSDKVNASVYLRCVDINKIKANTCYEANIWDK
ncbi:MAG: family 16 glycoside hydrolase, partial [Shewanella sp.]